MAIWTNKPPCEGSTDWDAPGASVTQNWTPGPAGVTQTWSEAEEGGSVLGTVAPGQASIGNVEYAAGSMATYASAAAAATSVLGEKYNLFDKKNFFFGTDKDVRMRYNPEAETTQGNPISPARSAGPLYIEFLDTANMLQVEGDMMAQKLLLKTSGEQAVYGTLTTETLSVGSERVWTLPDESGTLVLSSEIPGLGGDFAMDADAKIIFEGTAGGYETSLYIEEPTGQNTTLLLPKLDDYDPAISSATLAILQDIPDWTDESTGTIDASNIPSVALTTIQVAADETAMLGLSADEGDVIVRTDESKTYMHNGGSAGDMNDFTELASIGGSGATDLGISATGSAFTITSSSGDDG